MEPKQTQIKKLVLTALFVAIATYGGSLFSFPIGITKCAPVQSLVNVLSGIILGPWWALGQALATSILRNLLGTGTVFAFPGSMIGAFLAGWLYQKFKKPVLAVLGEVVGTGLVGALVAVPLAMLLFGKGGLMLFIPSFSASAVVGAALAYVLVRALWPVISREIERG
ncbi:energy coupling factor transporter S component ThiW [Limosilactobacillus fermentum]|uniref:energy coupling factor transporter S component ThiW n=1 Tax=Limosilactobacillus fermentum TaxID=1613 RepID=UPI000CE2AE47|nr:energy coupling factor transporter S component ThiW [Limosilactobacillus fermentum]SNX32262.1 thiamine-precursor transporter protein ThiW [Limosilactobacillus fermentum]